MGDFFYWGLLALVLTFIYFRKPRKPKTDDTGKIYVITFSRWRDRDLLDFLSCFAVPESYVLDLIQSDLSGGSAPTRLMSPAGNSLKKTRTLRLKPNSYFKKELISHLDSYGAFYNSYVKKLVRKDMMRKEGANLVFASTVNAAN